MRAREPLLCLPLQDGALIRSWHRPAAFFRLPENPVLAFGVTEVQNAEVTPEAPQYTITAFFIMENQKDTWASGKLFCLFLSS